MLTCPGNRPGRASITFHYNIIFFFCQVSFLKILCLQLPRPPSLQRTDINYPGVKFSQMSNFQAAAKSNFHSSCSCDQLSNFKKLSSCARPSNFKNFLFLSWKKVENFFNLYYNKRGNININIFYITIFCKFQIFSAH